MADSSVYTKEGSFGRTITHRMRDATDDEMNVLDIEM